MTLPDVSRSRRWLMLVGALSLLAIGCNSNDFNDGKARGLLEANPVKLDAEQVVLSLGQVDCGVKEDLWDPPVDLGQERSLARLTAKGRALKFDDDVVVSEAGYHFPFVQVRGTFSLGVTEITSTKAGPQPETKLVETKVGIRIDDACFPAPLPLMGLRRGQFSQEFSPVASFYNDNGWQFDKFVH